MTYLDASVIVAILGRESDGDALLQRLDTSTRPLLISPSGLFEAVLSLASKKARDTGVKVDAALIQQAQNAVSKFLDEIGAQEVAITPAMGHAAIEAVKRYGRAVGSPADLNFGDCLAYACAAEHGAVPLYKGNDFSRTDLG